MAELRTRVPMIVRGPGLKLWEYFHDPEKAPLEIGLWGRAGASKSWSILLFLLWLAHRYPRIPGRVAICRETRKSLTASACVTIRKILPIGHPSLEGPSDEHRSEYRFGEWTFGLFGLAKPGHLYSTEWDIAYVQEAREIGQGPWEEFTRGMRNDALYRYNADGVEVPDGQGVLAHPWCPRILDTNPGLIDSWMLKREKRGALLMLQAHREDNPAYWDIENGRETPRGASFERQLEALTGTRRDRLRDAKWTSAEGAIWPEFSVERHIVDWKRDEEGWVTREELKRHDVREFYAGMDLGFSNAAVLLVGAYTGKRELIIVAEVHFSEKGVVWWEEWIRQIHEHYPITLCFCDHNRKDWVQAFNDVVGAPREGPGAIFVNADKGVDRGLEIVRRRWGTPKHEATLFFERDCVLHEPDPVAMRRQIPWRTIDEIPDYTRKASVTSDDADETKPRQEKPDKARCHDDGCDALRYLAVGVEYFEPEPELLAPPDSAYVERLKAIYRFSGEEDEEIDALEMQDDAEDFIADRLRDMFAPKD